MIKFFKWGHSDQTVTGSCSTLVIMRYMPYMLASFDLIQGLEYKLQNKTELDIGILSYDVS